MNCEILQSRRLSNPSGGACLIDRPTWQMYSTVLTKLKSHSKAIRWCPPCLFCVIILKTFLKGTVLYIVSYSIRLCHFLREKKLLDVCQTKLVFWSIDLLSPGKTRYRVREEGAGCKYLIIYLFLEQWLTTYGFKGKISWQSCFVDTDQDRQMFSPGKTRYRVREEGAGCKYLFLEELLTTCYIKSKIWAGSKYLSILERWLATCVLKGNIWAGNKYLFILEHWLKHVFLKQDVSMICIFCGSNDDL